MSEWIITRDGRPTYGRYATESAAFGELLKRQPQSTDWAIKHEGWNVLEVPAGAWSELEARELRATAQRMFADHGHAGYWDKLTRENCGACVLEGYGAEVDPEYGTGHLEPNYSSWARTYVQAGREIPARFAAVFAAIVADGAEDNASYHAALLLDIATFGAHVEGASA